MKRKEKNIQDFIKKYNYILFDSKYFEFNKLKNDNGLYFARLYKNSNICINEVGIKYFGYDKVFEFNKELRFKNDLLVIIDDDSLELNNDDIYITYNKDKKIKLEKIKIMKIT